MGQKKRYMHKCYYQLLPHHPLYSTRYGTFSLFACPSFYFHLGFFKIVSFFFFLFQCIVLDPSSCTFQYSIAKNACFIDLLIWFWWFLHTIYWVPDLFLIGLFDLDWILLWKIYVDVLIQFMYPLVCFNLVDSGVKTQLDFLQQGLPGKNCFYKNMLLFTF